MCGIYGIIKKNLVKNNLNISEKILMALNLLKNRGYDSCGIFMIDNNNNEFIEKIGIDGEYIENLKKKYIYENFNIDIFYLLEKKILEIKNSENLILGIGHTRWATHGKKNDINSHPHVSFNGKIKIVHNGIISNYFEIKMDLLKNYNFISMTDTEVIANLIEYLLEKNKSNIIEALKELNNLLEGTWSCIIYYSEEPDKLFFSKNENPLLIGESEESIIFTSEPSGFMNMVSEYYLLRDKAFGYAESNGKLKIYGDFKKLDLIKSSDTEITLSKNYSHWMYKEIMDQKKLGILVNPITGNLRFTQTGVSFDFDFIKSCKYLYIIGCGSSYYAGLIASNYFRYTKAFEFVNVFDGGEFTKAHLESIEDPELNLLVLLISQSGETRDLNIATTICREFSSNRKNILEPNKLLITNSESLINLSLIQENNCIENKQNSEIKIIGIINVIGSLISRRTIDNIYTNCGRENAVASTKSCTSQILACLLLAIYKSELNSRLNLALKKKFLFDLNNLESDISKVISLENKIKNISNLILSKKKSNMFILGKDELYGSALEGALKIKEVAYIHAEGFNITALKHGPYALIEQDTPIILLYKERNHFVKSIIEEIKTRGAFVIEISFSADNSNPNSICLPSNRTFVGLLAVISLQLLSYHMAISQNINPDMPRNLAKVVTVD